MTSTAPHRVSRPLATSALPEFIKPTPTRIPPEDLEYLAKKGALTLPSEPLRSELLNSHFNFVHPYMPLLNKKEFLDSVTSEDESKGKTSLLLFQAVMFSGSAVCLIPPRSWRFGTERVVSLSIWRVSGWLDSPPEKPHVKRFSPKSGYVKTLPTNDHS